MMSGLINGRLLSSLRCLVLFVRKTNRLGLFFNSILRRVNDRIDVVYLVSRIDLGLFTRFLEEFMNVVLVIVLLCLFLLISLGLMGSFLLSLLDWLTLGLVFLIVSLLLCNIHLLLSSSLIFVEVGFFSSISFFVSMGSFGGFIFSYSVGVSGSFSNCCRLSVLFRGFLDNVMSFFAGGFSNIDRHQAGQSFFLSITSVLNSSTRSLFPVIVSLVSVVVVISSVISVVVVVSIIISTTVVFVVISAMIIVIVIVLVVITSISSLMGSSERLLEA